ncbi:HEAT repeat domain-containing protein [Streptomyces sp. NPDC002685]|uniref:HEAT repeat domain-containing protein n=1 Tax=Streptomyces sp. NPDC002685 TaxID=3154540 RepID=UPI00331C451D
MPVVPHQPADPPAPEVGTRHAEEVAALRALSGPVRSVRIAAVGRLASFGTSTAASALIGFLDDDDPAVARRAFRALRAAHLGLEHIDPLVLLAGRRTRACIPVLRLLAPLASDARVPPVLAQMVADGLWRFDGYREVADALAKNGRSLVPKLCALLGSSDETVRRLAFSTLAKIGDDRALDRMLDYLAMVDKRERSDMSFALRDLGAPAATLAAALRHSNAATRAAAVCCLADPSDTSVLELVLQDVSVDVRLSAVAVLKGGGTRRELSAAQLSLVERALGDADPRVRCEACDVAFNRMADAVPLLTPLLTDEDPTVRVQAVKVLGWCERPELVHAFNQALLDDTDWVRVEAANALGRLTGKASLPVERLIALLHDRQPFARIAAAEVLGALKERRAVPALCECVFDDNEFVPERAVQALASIGDESAVPTLARAFATMDELTRRAASEALVTIGTPSAFDVLTHAARRKPVDYALITALSYANDEKALPALELIAAHYDQWGGFSSLRYSVERTLDQLRGTAREP